MKYAKEVATRNGQDVPAAAANPYREYVCPVCSAEVFLRRGSYRVPHFAHAPGSASPDCENYTPSSYSSLLAPHQAAPSHELRPAKPRLQPPFLAIAVSEGITDKRTRWELRITIPKSDAADGFIRYDFGDPAPRTITLRKLAQGSGEYVAQPVDRGYRAVEGSPDISAPYWAAVREPVQALANAAATAFEGSPERLKKRVRSVTCGEPYYFVLRNEQRALVPAFVEPRFLSESGGWCCCLASIPDEPSQKERDAITDFAGVTISASTRELSLIYPTDTWQTILGTTAAPSLDCVMFGARGSESNQPANLWFAADGEIAEVPIGGFRGQIAQVLAKRPKRVDSRWDGRLVARLTAVDPPSDADECAVRFYFAGNERPAVAAHHPSAAAALADVRTRRRAISHVSLPAALRGTMTWNRPGQPPQSRDLGLHVVGSRGTGLRNLQPDDFSHLCRLVEDPTLDLHVDFGGFGHLHLSAASPRRQVVTLTPALRHRILWLCALDRSSAVRRTAVCQNDTDLVRRFQQLRPTTSLAAHFRAAQRALDASGLGYKK